MWYNHFEVRIMTMYSIGEFGKQRGVTPQTLRNWGKRGELKLAHVSQGGTRYYSEEQRNQFLGIAGRKTKANNHRLL